VAHFFWALGGGLKSVIFGRERKRKIKKKDGQIKFEVLGKSLKPCLINVSLCDGQLGEYQRPTSAANRNPKLREAEDLMI